MDEITNWEPSLGHLVPGAVVDPYQFVGAMPVALLISSVADPRLPRAGAESSVVDESSEPAGWERALEGSKRRNVQSYVQFILAATAPEPEDGDRDARQPGLLPPIVLWRHDPLGFARLPSGLALVLPYDAQLEALDGGTQVAAWHDVVAMHPERRKVLLPVVIHSGRPARWARQAFRDLQTRAIKSVGVDDFDLPSDPIADLARHIEASVELFNGRVSRERQLPVNDQAVVTASTLRTACATFVLGLAGVQRAARPPESIPGIDEERIREQGGRWFGAVAEHLSSEFSVQRRGESVLPSPGAMAAVGAFGHPLLRLDGAAAENQLGWRIDRLTRVDWQRDERWNGIAGQMTASGTLSFGGGARQHAYAIFKALETPDSPIYRREERGSDT